MKAEDVVIQLELTLAGESLTGRASSGAGPAREFSGRLGLMAAVDALIELNRTDATVPGGRENLSS